VVGNLSVRTVACRGSGHIEDRRIARRR